MAGGKTLENGFTLMELVLAIVILGVLAAVALPKFYSLRKDAEIASVQGTMAGFAGSINTIHAYWAVKRSGAGILAIPNVGNMRFNAAGYPQPYDPATGLGGDPGCVALFKQMILPVPLVSSTDLPGYDWYSDVGPSSCDYFYNRKGSPVKCQASVHYDSSSGAVHYIQYNPGDLGAACVP